MSKKLRTLLIEDTESDALLLLRELRRSGYEVEFERVETADAMKAALDKQSWDIVISDYSLPSFSGPDALAVLQKQNLDLPFLIVSGTIGEDRAVSALLAGAHDFLIKGQLARLVPAIERELREAENRRSKREADAALQASEARYRLLFDSNPAPLWVYDLETLAILAVNNAAVLQYGYSQDEFLKLTIQDIHLAEDAQTVADTVPKILPGLQATGFWQHRKKDGTVIDVEITSHDLLFGSRAARLVLPKDITQRKRAEEKLQRYNQRLATLHTIDKAILTAKSPEIIGQIALDFIGPEMAAEEASLTLFVSGSTQPEVIAHYSRNQTTAPTNSPFPSQEFSREDLQKLETGEIQQVEAAEPDLTLTPGLQATNHRESYSMIPLLAQGELIGSLNLRAKPSHSFTSEQLELSREVADQLAIAIQQTRFREQIQRHAAQLEQRVIERTAELQQTKDRVEAILDNSSDAIILTNYDGIIQQINPAFNELFGYQESDVIGQSLLTLSQPQDAAILLEVLRSVVSTHHSNRVELNVFRKNGETFYADVALASIHQSAQNKGLVCSVRDMTERKRMEQGLRGALEKEKELNELKTRFTSMVSHEFRTPLTIILSSSGMLDRYLDRMTEEKRHERLNQIQMQVQRLVALLDDVLTISRAEKVTVEASAVPLNLKQFCSGVVAEMQETTQKHQIELSVRGTCREILLDSKLMRQAITNLLSNAVKYSPTGGTVDFDLSFEDQQVIIRIQDHGIGIPEADQQRIFEGFHRAKNVGDISGTGLGLPIVKRAVEAHKGTLSMDSRVGEGTTFTIRLPMNLPLVESKV